MFLISRRDSSSIPDCPYCLERIRLVRLLSGSTEILLCPSCETEFVIDKYTTELELWLGNHQESKSENVVNFSNGLKNYGNDLCRSCNHNQMIIMQLLHAYGNEEIQSTFAEDVEDEEAFEEYKNILEIKYPLCKLCRGVVRRKLDAQAALARANYLAAQAVRGKISILAFNRRMSARRRLLFYSLLLFLSLTMRIYNYNIASAFASLLLFCLYPSSVVYKVISFFIFSLRILLLFFITDVEHSFHQANFFSSPINPIIVDFIVHICFINPDILQRLFAALKPISSPRPTDRKEKKQLQLYHEIVTKENISHNKENAPQRFSPRPSILSIPGTGIEESLALCSLQENSTSLARKVTLPRFKRLFPFLIVTLSFLSYLFIFWKLLNGNIEYLSYHSIGLILYGEIIQLIFRRNLVLSVRVLLLTFFSLMMYQMLFVNWHSTERVESVFCSFYSITSMLLMI